MKTEGTINEKQSRGTGNIGHIRHMININKTKNTIGEMSNGIIKLFGQMYLYCRWYILRQWISQTKIKGKYRDARYHELYISGKTYKQ